MARVLTDESTLTLKQKALLKETDTLSRLVRIEAVLAVFLLVSGVVLYFWRGQAGVFWLGAAATIFFAGHFMKIRQNRLEEKRVQAGLRGETQVTRALAEKLDNTHYVLNDITVRMGRQSAQIDHLVVSPRGLCVIETKNWRGHLEGGEQDDRWTQTRKPGDHPVRVSNPLRQVRRHIEFLSGALRRGGLDWPDLYGILVFTSPYTTFTVNTDAIPVMKPHDAVAYIANKETERTYSEEEISKALNLFVGEG